MHTLHSLGGHRGVQATKAMLLGAGYYWRQMTSDISDYVQHCHACQLKGAQTLITPDLLGQSDLYKPFSAWHVDLTGKLSWTNSRGKPVSAYIFVAVEAFTRTVELCVMRHKSSREAAYALWSLVLSIYGIPLLLPCCVLCAPAALPPS